MPAGADTTGPAQKAHGTFRTDRREHPDGKKGVRDDRTPFRSYGTNGGEARAVTAGPDTRE